MVPLNKKKKFIKVAKEVIDLEIKLHKNDLPDDLNLGNVIAVDGNLWVLMSDGIHCV